MNIFGKKRAGQPSPLEVAVPEAKGGKIRQYHLRAALAKALLLFMLMFGAVSGYLSAYEMEYNELLCAAALLGFSLILGLLYETGVKSFTNLAMILIFIVYAYMAVTRFRILNSGTYAVVNKMYEVARGYLGISDGSAYSLQIQDTYRAVTGIAIFLGVVGIILTAIRIQYKAGFLSTFLMTFLLYPIPLYFDRRPSQLSIFLLLAGYTTLLIVQCSGSRKCISEQIRRALPIGIVLSAAVILAAAVLVPQRQYRLRMPKNPRKAASEGRMTVFAQFGIIALFQNSAASGGISGGRLSNSAVVVPRYKTDLLVRFTPYDMEPIYLKAFTGLDYRGDSWTDVRTVLPEDDAMLHGMPDTKEWFASRPDIQGRGIMEVVNVDAASGFLYRPYYTEDDTVVRTGDTLVCIYYPPVSDVEIGCGALDDRYLQVPRSCLQAVGRACGEAGLQGSPEEIAEQIIKYFSDNYIYTLRPGYNFGNSDYISYFLEKNKKGYCSHFASAGTMLFRYMGIPARYVCGYAFSYADMALEGTLLEDEYGDYYSGYSPLGETALVEVEVSDAQAHAWVEIYLDGKGWVVVDPTPAALEEEDVGDFWENFGFGTGEESEGDQGVGGLSSYLENMLEKGRGCLLAVLAAGAVLLLVKKAVQRERERRLPAPERVRLEYHRLTEMTAKKNGDFAAFTTPAQELERIGEEWGLEFPKGFAEQLYRVFFAPDSGQECEELYRELVGIRREIRRGQVRRGRGKKK